MEKALSIGVLIHIQQPKTAAQLPADLFGNGKRKRSMVSALIC